MDNCIFCKIVKGEIPSKKIYDDDNNIAFLDINPNVDGHTLIIPKKHYEDFTKLDNESILEMYSLGKKLTSSLMKKLNAKAMTFTMNYGDSQEVKHVHLHLLPDFRIKDKNKTVDEVYEIIGNLNES